MMLRTTSDQNQTTPNQVNIVIVKPVRQIYILVRFVKGDTDCRKLVMKSNRHKTRVLHHRIAEK